MHHHRPVHLDQLCDLFTVAIDPTISPACPVYGPDGTRLIAEYRKDWPGIGVALIIRPVTPAGEDSK